MTTAAIQVQAHGSAAEVVPPKPQTALQVLRSDRMAAQIRAALPAHVDAARFIRVALTTVQQTPDLLQCTRESLFARLMQCAALGLEPDGLLGHAYLVPFDNKGRDGKWRKEVQLIVGYRGLIKLARQSGEVTDVSARVVHAKDDFDYEHGLTEVLRHKPYMVRQPDDDAGPITHVYAVFRLRGGGAHFDIMSTAEIERIRQKSKSGNSPAWRDHWDEMAKKTVIRRASKFSPASIDDKVSKAIALDERADAGLPQDVDGSGALIDDGDAPAAQLLPDSAVEDSAAAG